jgi:hypothetical protein
MAKVALTNGRDDFRDEADGRRDLFCLADLMLQRRDFLFHFTQADAPRHAARPVEEVNDPAGRAAKENDEKSK